MKKSSKSTRKLSLIKKNIAALNSREESLLNGGQKPSARGDMILGSMGCVGASSPSWCASVCWGGCR